MEGSGAGGTAGSGGDAGPAQGGEAGGGSQQDAGHDFASFAEQIGEMQPAQEDAWAALTAQQLADLGEPQPIEDPDGPGDFEGLDEQDAGADPGVLDALAGLGLDDAEAAELAPHLDAWVSEEVSERVQQATAPLAEQMRETQQRTDFEALERDFPRLRDPQAAEQLIEISTQYAAHIGRPDLATDPGFLRHVLERAEHAEMAAKRAAASAERQDPGDAIVRADADQGAAALPFRGGQ